MAKTYNTNWLAKPLSINFNQKQWRQDLAAYVREHLFWGITKVSRAKCFNGPDLYSKIKGAKTFYIYNDVGGQVIVHFEEDNKILDTTHEDLIKKYFEERGVKNEKENI